MSVFGDVALGTDTGVQYVFVSVAFCLPDIVIKQ